ncbi:YybS family protein [Veillonella criceti]|uniref:Predicted membrane protein n=1 Tax=Veillonella criceti TaxID=103891 RepID=A0A380NMA4_9FIRM|nr:DUF2232 domain-containing protein [Veillonella criceti]SUP44088.1 Predicted membrane protein [Veillonella criceti]
MKYSETRAVVETGFLTALIMVFTFIGLTVPAMGVFASILMPAVLVVLGARHGIKWSILATITSGVVMSIVITPLMAFMQVLTSGVPGIVLAYGYERRWPTARLLTLPALTMMVMIAVQLGIGQYIMQVDLVQTWQQFQQETLVNMEEAYRAQGLLDDQIKSMVDSMATLFKQMAYVAIAALFMSSVIISYAICKVANVIVRRTGGQGVTLPTMDQWRVPQWAVYIFALGILLTYWGDQYQSEVINVIAYNLYALGSYMLVLQGLGCMWSIFKSYGLSAGFRLVLIFLTLLMNFATLWIGMLDLIFNLRRRLSKRSDDEE